MSLPRLMSGPWLGLGMGLGIGLSPGLGQGMGLAMGMGLRLCLGLSPRAREPERPSARAPERPRARGTDVGLGPGPDPTCGGCVWWCVEVERPSARAPERPSARAPEAQTWAWAQAPTQRVAAACGGVWWSTWREASVLARPCLPRLPRLSGQVCPTEQLFIPAAQHAGARH